MKISYLLISFFVLISFSNCSHQSSQKDGGGDTSIVTWSNKNINLKIGSDAIRIFSQNEKIAVIKSIRFNFTDPLKREVVSSGKDKVMYFPQVKFILESLQKQLYSE